MNMTRGRAVYAMKTDLRETSKWWMIAPKMQKTIVDELKPAVGRRLVGL